MGAAVAVVAASPASPVPFAPGVVAVAGSRLLPWGTAAIVQLAVMGLCGSGFGLSVGCCGGADAVALRIAAGHWSGRVSCFAAFGADGAGAGQWSAVSVVQGAASLGVAVSWLAGGARSRPLSARLAARTRAVVAAASSGLVVFFASPGSRGSLLACQTAVGRGLPVLAFPLGFPGSALPSLGAGSWVPFNGCGVWSSAWQWVPDQAGLLSCL